MFPRICFSHSVKEKVATPIFPNDLQAIMQSPFVQEICDKIVLLDGKDPDEMARLKQQLPVVYFHAQSFKNNLRKSANAVPSGLVMLDIDHVENPNDFLALEFLEKDAGNIREFLKENRIALIAKTPSNHGIRIVGEMQQGETIVQAQQRLANLFEVKQYDAVTKDLARASFVMPWSYVYYFDEEILQSPDQATAEKWGDSCANAVKEVRSPGRTIDCPSTQVVHTDLSCASAALSDRLMVPPGDGTSLKQTQRVLWFLSAYSLDLLPSFFRPVTVFLPSFYRLVAVFLPSLFRDRLTEK